MIFFENVAGKSYCVVVAENVMKQLAFMTEFLFFIQPENGCTFQ